MRDGASPKVQGATRRSCTDNAAKIRGAIKRPAVATDGISARCCISRVIPPVILSGVSNNFAVRKRPFTGILRTVHSGAIKQQTESSRVEYFFYRTRTHACTHVRERNVTGYSGRRVTSPQYSRESARSNVALSRTGGGTFRDFSPKIDDPYDVASGKILMFVVLVK